MDPVSASGVAFGVIGLAGQLLTAGMECYTVFSSAKDFSVDHDSFSWELETERERLRRWEAIWGVDSNGLRQGLDPGDRRYRYAVGTLARILALFADVDNLGTRYGIQGRSVAKANACPPSVTKAYGRRRDRFLSILPSPRARSRTRENIATKSGTEMSSSLELIPIDASGIEILENPSVLQNEDLIPGLREEIQKLNKAAVEMQKLLPIYRKLQWAIIDKARASQLVEQLRKYNDGLFNVLPEPGRTGSASTAPSALFSKFDVLFRLPVQRNKNFKGREDLLEKIHSVLKPDETSERRVVILHGLGGMGKSQISIEYAYRYKTIYTSVFWIDATSQETLSRSALLMAEQLVAHYKTKWADSDPDFVRIGVMLGLPAGCIEPTGQISVKGKEAGSGLVMEAMEKWLSDAGNSNWLVIEAMGKWLSAAGNSNWLVIFENNDDIETVKLQDFVPAGEFGSIIITTRRPEISYLGVGVEVEQVDRDAGVSILLASAGKDLRDINQEDLAEAGMIAEKLGYFPLALNQAGGYIVAMQMPLQQYLPLYTRNFRRVVSTKHPSLANYRNDTFFTAWQISFNALPLPSSELLLLCAFLGSQNIVGEVFQRGRDTISWLGKDDDLIHDALKPLLSFSFAKRDNELDRFVFHPLVLEWARESLNVTERKRKAKEAVILIGKVLDYKQEDKSTTDWIFESRIMAHVDTSLRNFREYLLPDLENCKLEKDAVDAVENIGNLCIYHCRLKDAEEIIGTILVSRQNTPTEGDQAAMTRIFNSFNDMGLILIHQVRYEEALKFFKKAAAGRERILGEEHPDTLFSLCNVARLLLWQGKCEEALELYQKLLVVSERALGKESNRTLDIVNDMARVMMRQKRYEESRVLYGQVLARKEQTLGKEHSSTLTTVYYIASLMQAQERYEEALPLYERVLAGEEKTLGGEHSDTLLTVYAIASLMQTQERYEEALPLYERVLAGYEKTLGGEHPNTLTTVYAIASLMQAQGRYEEALPLYERVLAGYEKTLGGEHHSTLLTVYAIASLMRAQGRYEEALPLYERVLAGREKTLGGEHPNTLLTVYAIASLMKAQERYEEALPLYERVLAGEEKTLGGEHLNTLATVYAIASLMEAQGRYEEALPLYERVLAGREKTLGGEHLNTLLTVYAIASLMKAQERYEEALPLYERVLAGFEKTLGGEHLNTLITASSMAKVLEAQGQHEEARDLFQRVLDGRRKALGEDHRSTISAARHLSRVQG